MHPMPTTLVTLDGRASAWCGGAVLPALESLLDMAEMWWPGTYVGISGANRSGTYTTLVANHQLVFDLDSLQNDLDEGPGLAALRGDHTVVVDDADSEHRWPSFVPRALEAALRSLLSVPLSLDTKTFGVLNLYSATYLPVDAQRLTQAKLLAGQAALALAQAQREHQLTVALRSNRTIGMAVGLAMERFGLDDHRAFSYLTDLSLRARVDLREVATHLVEQANTLHAAAQPPPAAGPSEADRDADVPTPADRAEQPSGVAPGPEEGLKPSGAPVAEAPWPAVAVES